MIALLIGAAFAADVTFCIDILTQYTDAFPNVSPVYDDYLNDNTTPVPLRGVKWCVSTPNVTVCEYANSEAPDIGCATFLNLTENSPLQVDIRTEARVTNAAGYNTVLVWNDDVNQDPFVTVFETNWYATVDETRDYLLQGAVPAWDHLTAVTWALHHRHAALTGQVFWVIDTLSPGGCFCFKCDSDGVNGASDECGGPDTTDHDSIFVTTTRKRYNVIHEFGHYLQVRRNEGQTPSITYKANADGCFYNDPQGHEFQQKEFVSAAWAEGFAHFYAAVTFNKGTETDCRFQYYKEQNYDFDDLPLPAPPQTPDPDPSEASPPPEGNSINCEGVPDQFPGGAVLEPGDPLDPSIDSFDYLYDSVVTLGCGGTIENRGTEYDFLRFWWDLYTDGDSDWSFGDIMNVVDRTDPHLWLGLGDLDPNGQGVWPDLPTPTIEAALDQAVTDGVITSAMRTQWLNKSSVNGTDR